MSAVSVIVSPKKTVAASDKLGLSALDVSK